MNQRSKSRLGPSFFGLPKYDSPELAKFCSDRKINVLSELRIICREIGYEAARKMPSEIRRWWISKMFEEAKEKNDAVDAINNGGNTHNHGGRR